MMSKFKCIRSRSHCTPIDKHCGWKLVVKHWKNRTPCKRWVCVMAANCLSKIWDRKLAGKPYFWLNMPGHWPFICGSISDHGFSLVIPWHRLVKPHSEYYMLVIQTFQFLWILCKTKLKTSFRRRIHTAKMYYKIPTSRMRLSVYLYLVKIINASSIFYVTHNGNVKEMISFLRCARCTF